MMVACSENITVNRSDLVAVLHGWGIDDPDDESYEAWKRLLDILSRPKRRAQNDAV